MDLRSRIPGRRTLHLVSYTCCTLLSQPYRSSGKGRSPASHPEIWSSCSSYKSWS